MTGYVQILLEKNLSPAQFVTLCARAFGYCTRMRDDPLENPLPEKFEADPYYLETYEKAKSKLAAIESVKKKDITAWAKQAINKTLENCMSNSQDHAEREVCEKLTKEISNWKAGEDHINLKNFALSQLKTVLNHETHDEYYKKEIDRLKQADPKEYYLKELETAKIQLRMAKESWEKELERINKANKWLSELREPLKETYGNV